MDDTDRDPNWTLLTSHARVLIQIARAPGSRLTDIAATTGLSDTAVQTIITDLQQAGYLTHSREADGSGYHINSRLPLGYRGAEAHITIGDLLALFTR